MRIVAVDPDSCVACRNCEYACAFRQSGDFERAASHIRVNFYPLARLSIPLTCMHCTEAWCQEVCPAGAISRDLKTDAVVIDAARCAGCKMCLMACPFGNIHFNEVQGVSAKCDLCGGDPACVRSCTSGALRYMDMEETVAARRETLDLRLVRVLGLGKGEE